MAGPWFTVTESGDAPTPIGRVWLSDGRTDGLAWLEMQTTLRPPGGDP